MTLSSEWHKIICRFIGAEGAVPEIGHIEVRWEIHDTPREAAGPGISLSRLHAGKGKEKEETADPFADDSVATPTVESTGGNWVEIEMSRRSISGKYEVK